MFKIDPDHYYTFEELENQGVASRTTIYRRIKEKKIKAEKSIGGDNVIKGSEILSYMKKHPVAS